MIPAPIRAALSRQYGACLAMLREAIEQCPDTLWTRSQRPLPFWQIAYHTAGFLDFYAGESREGFSPRLGIALMFREMPEAPLPRQEVLGYVDALGRRLSLSLEQTSATDEHAFPWTGPDVADLWLYNLRHAQHHVGQLYARLAEEAGVHLKWVASEALPAPLEPSTET